MSSPIKQSFICPMFIGRTTQLAVLTNLIAEVSGTNGRENSAAQFRVALIVGEAGIGKTRIVKESIQIALQHKMIVLQGRCFEQDRMFPYGPVRDLINSFCSTHSQARIEQVIGPLASEIIKIFPELLNYMPNATASPLLSPDQEKRRLFFTLTKFLRNAQAEPQNDDENSVKNMPLLIIFEDLHWCDDLSIEFFLYMVRNTAYLPTLFVGTYRDDERNLALDQFLAEADRLRIVDELRLPRLSLGESDNMLRAILNPARPLGYDLLEIMFRQTEGNPFFIEETLKSLNELGDIFQKEGIWGYTSTNHLQVPRTLQNAVLNRLKKLNEISQKFIALAAVSGRRFQVEVLQQLLELSDQDLANLLRELVQAQLVIEESASAFTFRHALTREAIYLNLLGRERQSLHSSIGAYLERYYVGNLDAHINDLAYHFYESAEWSKAYEYSKRAGERAKEFDATRASLTHFTRALEAANKLGITPPFVLWRERAQAHQTLGNLDAALTDYESILKSAVAANDRFVTWQSFIDLGLVSTSHDFQRAGEYFQQALMIARELDEPALLAQTLNRVGNWRFMSGHPSEGRVLHSEALEIFKSVNDLHEIAGTLDLLGICSYGVGNLEEGGNYYAQAISLYRAMGDRHGLIACLCAYAARGGCYLTNTAVCVSANLEDLTRESEEAVQIAVQMGWRPNEAYTLSFLAFALGPHGEFKRALDAAKQSLAISTEIAHDFIKLVALVGLGALCFDMLAFEEAKQYFEQSDILAVRTNAAFVSSCISGYLALTYLALNDLDRATSLLASRLKDDTPLDSESLRWLWTARAELLLNQGQPVKALQIIERVIAAVPPTQAGKVVPRLWLVRSQVLRRLNRLTEAEQFLNEALEHAKECSLLPVKWRIQVELGYVLTAAQRVSEAFEVCNSAQASINHLSTKISEEKLHKQFLESASGLVPRCGKVEKRTPGRDFNGLTIREQDVAALIVKGRTNLEIAEELVLSRRTIEVHVANIMTKLGVRTRAQIAVWAVEKGLSK